MGNSMYLTVKRLMAKRRAALARLQASEAKAYLVELYIQSMNVFKDELLSRLKAAGYNQRTIQVYQDLMNN